MQSRRATSSHDLSVASWHDDNIIKAKEDLDQCQFLNRLLIVLADYILIESLVDLSLHDSDTM